MTSIVVRGDSERFCLGADPTCTGINPCRACWEMVRDRVMPGALRAANCTATEKQVLSFVREYFMGWCALIGGAQIDCPDLFAKTVQARHASLAKEWDDAQKMGRNPPLTPFGAVAFQTSQLQQPQNPIPQPQQAPMNVMQGRPQSSMQVPGQSMQQFPMQPAIQQTPIQPAMAPIKPPDWPPDDLGVEMPMVRGDVKRVVRNGPRRSEESPKKKEPSSEMVKVNGHAAMPEVESDEAAEITDRSES